jgi:hypothetical protein
MIGWFFTEMRGGLVVLVEIPRKKLLVPRLFKTIFPDFFIQRKVTIYGFSRLVELRIGNILKEMTQK